MIYEGATPLRSATKEEAATMPVFSTWGSKVISLLAERAFVAPRPGPGSPVVLTLKWPSVRADGHILCSRLRLCRSEHPSESLAAQLPGRALGSPEPG
jgi:hypothetical protein